MKLSRHQMLSIFFKLFTLAIATNLSACSTLSPTATPPPTFYVLDNPGRAHALLPDLTANASFTCGSLTSWNTLPKANGWTHLLAC